MRTLPRLITDHFLFSFDYLQLSGLGHTEVIYCDNPMNSEPEYLAAFFNHVGWLVPGTDA